MKTTCHTPIVLDVTLQPGDFYFGGQATRVHTLLGSCIAITMWHPYKHIGGMCHYMLPRRNNNRHLTSGHFADETLTLFMAAIREQRTSPQDYEVKIFGGSNMFAATQPKHSQHDVANANINAGLSLLQSHGFTILAQDLGGNVHRKLYFELWNGGVWVRYGSTAPISDKAFVWPK